MLKGRDGIFHDEAKFLLRIEGGGAKSYDDRGLWCYQLLNDGGGWSYQ